MGGTYEASCGQCGWQGRRLQIQLAEDTSGECRCPQCGQVFNDITSEEVEKAKAEEIARRNDAFRKSGKIVITLEVQALTTEQQETLFRHVLEFNTFTEDNDPNGEHDFGTIDLWGSTWYWKIDYYDGDPIRGDAAWGDPLSEKTHRILTVLNASEY